MSTRHPTEKERARQEKHLAALAEKTVKKTPADSHSDAVTAGDDEDLTLAAIASGVDRNRSYNPTTLRQAMGIGRRYYDNLMRAGLPHRKILGRYWFSGRRVLEFLELEDDGQQTGQR